MISGTKLVRRDHQLTRTNRTISIIAILLATAMVFQQLFFLSQEKEIRVFVPPQFAITGGSLSNDEPDTYNVFGFTNYILSYIYTWDTDAEVDYKDNIRDTAHYTSIKFKAQLNADYQARINRNGINELRSRTRILKPNLNNPFTETSSVKIAAGVWHVTLYYNLDEHIMSRAIKEHESMKYVFRVVYTGDDPSKNQWGLRIDSLISQERINTPKRS